MSTVVDNYHDGNREVLVVKTKELGRAAKLSKSINHTITAVVSNNYEIHDIRQRMQRRTQSKTLWAGGRMESMEDLHKRITRANTADEVATTDDNSESDALSTGRSNITSSKKVKYARLYKISKIPQTTDNLLQFNLESKSKSKIKHLNKFVSNYSNRKIMSGWDLIESKFKSSPHVNTVMEKGADGISYPSKVKILHLSSLTILLCSPEIRVKNTELAKLFLDLGFTHEDCENAKRVAACKLVLRTITEADKRLIYNKYLESLVRGGEKSITLDVLKTTVFPSDPAEYDAAMDSIQKARTTRLAQMVEDRRIKAEMNKKAEIRREKLILDFEQDLRTVQYSRGVMDLPRLLFLNSTVDFAKQAVMDAEAAATTGVDQEVIDLIGLDMFPRRLEDKDQPHGLHSTTHTSNKEEHEPVGKPPPRVKKTLSALISSLNEPKSTEPEVAIVSGKPKIHLRGNPTLVDLFRMCVATGKGLNGNAFSDVVELVQSFASIVIQAIFRGYRRRWRFKKAREMWTKRDRLRLKGVFADWAAFAKHFGAVKRLCWRKVKAWRFYIKRVKRRQALFRSCYWPMYVWRRTAQDARRAKEKAKFLVGRVMPTVLQIHVFRAWKSYTEDASRVTRLYKKFLQRRRLSALRQHLLWLARWARRRKRLRRAWYSVGLLRYEDKQLDCMEIPFLLWKAYVFLKHTVRYRVKALVAEVRRTLMSDRPCRRALNRKERFMMANQRRRRMQVGFQLDGGGGGDASGRGVRNRRQGGPSIKPSPGPAEVSVPSDASGPQSSTSSGVVPLSQYQHKDGDTVHFEWKPIHTDYDIDSDDEYEKDIPEKLFYVYTTSVPALIGADQVDFLQDASEEILECVDSMSSKFSKVEVWLLIEASMTFHRVCRRAFRNLRVHAIIRRNLRNAMRKRRHSILNKCIDVFRDWIRIASVNTPSLQLTMDLINGSDSVKTNQLAVAYDNFVIGSDEAATKDVDNVDLNIDLDLIPQERTLGEVLAYQAKRHRAEKNRLRKEVVNRIKMASELERMKLMYKDEEDDVSSADSSKKSIKRRSTIRKRTNSNLTSKKRMSTIQKAGVKLPSLTKVEEDPEELEKRVIEEAILFVTQKRSTDLLHKLEESNAKPLTSGGSTTGKSFPRRPRKVTDEERVTVLTWDREDREKELFLSQAMSTCSRRMYQDSLHAVEQANRDDAERARHRGMKTIAFSDLSQQETRDTTTAENNELKYASEFKINAAGLLVDALVKVNFERILAQEIVVLKHNFRSIRLPLLEKRSISMRNRVRLVNWIRLCKRLIFIAREAPKYHLRRTQWTHFCRWLKLLEKERLNASCGFADALKRRVALLITYSDYLRDNGYTRTVYPYESRIRIHTSSFAATFKRWQQYVQEKCLFRLMKEKSIYLHKLRILFRCFHAFHSSSNAEATRENSTVHEPFVIIRIRSDLDQMTKRFVAHRKRSLYQRVCHLNSRYIYCTIRDARRFPSFKVFITDFRKDCNSRIMMEQRLLLEAFENKGKLEYKDLLVPSPMNVGDGEIFADPIMSDEGTDLPPGFKISKLKVVVQEGMGIVGWQLLWAGDGQVDRESPTRGKWNGAGSVVHMIEVEQDDFLTALEIVFEGSVITALRGFCHLAGWSQVIGSRVSGSSYTVVLRADDIPTDPHEMKIGHEELRAPGMPRKYITGLTGLENVTRSTGIGLVVRRVRTHTIFSYYWVQKEKEQDQSVKAKPEVPRWQVPSATTSNRPGGRYFRKLKVVNTNSAEALVSTINSATEQKHDEKLSAAEEEFFNVLRMRLTELRAAEGRAVTFARRLWSNPRLTRGSTPVLSSITIVPALTKWFFESRSKYLVPPPLSETQASQLQKDARLVRIRGDLARKRITILESDFAALSIRTATWRMAKLTDKERKLMQVDLDRKEALKEEMEQLRRDADRIEASAERMKAEGESLLPELQMSVRVCNNFKMKISAARHLSSLLERMDVYEVKERLSVTAKNSPFSLSSEEMELVSYRLRNTGLLHKDMNALSLHEVVQEDLAAEKEREKEEQRLRSEREQKLALGRTKEESRQNKVSCRRKISVDPWRTSRAQGRNVSSASSQSSYSQKSSLSVRIPGVKEVE